MVLSHGVAGDRCLLLLTITEKLITCVGSILAGFSFRARDILHSRPTLIKHTLSYVYLIGVTSLVRSVIFDLCLKTATNAM